MKTVYVLTEDSGYGADCTVFSSRELAEKAFDDVLKYYEKQYGKPMDQESLANNDIYVTIQESNFVE